MNVTTLQSDQGVFVFKYHLEKIKVGHVAKILNCSDIHIDSKSCNRELLKKHCEEADFIKIYGDLFDLMQGRDDKRRANSAMKTEYLANNYIDKVVQDAVEFFKPYAKKLLFVGLGNHETSVINKLGTNPISSFCFMMRQLGSVVIEGSYQGYVVDCFVRPDIKKYLGGTVKTAFHHGHGGAPQKTEGALEMVSDVAKYPNADIVVKGHNHFKWHNPGQTSYFLNAKYAVEQRVQHHIRLGTYKMAEFTEGWSVEKGFKPATVGSWFINYEMYHYEKNSSGKAIRFNIQSAE